MAEAREASPGGLAEPWSKTIRGLRNCAGRPKGCRATSGETGLINFEF